MDADKTGKMISKKKKNIKYNAKRTGRQITYYRQSSKQMGTRIVISRYIYSNSTCRNFTYKLI